MTEAGLKVQLGQTLRVELAESVVFRHEDRTTAGIPDVSVTWQQRTCWFEVKLADPELELRGLQTINALKLSRTGYCFFVIYEEKRGVKRTVIADPWLVHMRRLDQVPDECVTTGFNHSFVADFIRRLHNDGARSV